MMRQLRALVVSLVLLLPAVGSAQNRVQLVINADLGKDTISRHIYGHFAEHLGRGIYDGFWSKAGSGEWHLRDDVSAALRRIKIPNLRWPGGCFADYYHWQDGIGPRADRPVMVNTLWGGVTEDNSFGTHEYMELVQRLGTEAFVVGNVGSGTVQEMASWWEYLNHPGGSSLANQRAQNGHPEPFKVRFWGVGNESWGCGGAMTPEHYADAYKNFAEFLRPMGKNRAFRIATGPNSGDYNWTETGMENAGWMIDGIDLHYYTVVARRRARHESWFPLSAEYVARRGCRRPASEHLQQSRRPCAHGQHRANHQRAAVNDSHQGRADDSDADLPRL